MSSTSRSSSRCESTTSVASSFRPRSPQRTRPRSAPRTPADRAVAIDAASPNQYGRGQAMSQELMSLATQAYVFGFAFVFNVNEMIVATTKPRMATAAPVNLFAYATTLASPADRFVSVNNDTLYTFASCDVTVEPL